jgi:hypothetical protein
VHLTNANLFGDLRLGHPFNEPESQDQAFALRERLEGRQQHLMVVCPLVASVDSTEPGGDGAVVVIRGIRSAAEGIPVK